MCRAMCINILAKEDFAAIQVTQGISSSDLNSQIALNKIRRISSFDEADKFISVDSSSVHYIQGKR